MTPDAKPYEYRNKDDLPKIISMLENIVIKNNWDANVGVGPGDYAFGDIRIPAKHVPEFVEMLKDVAPTADRGDPIATAYYRGKANGRKEGRKQALEEVVTLFNIERGSQAWGWIGSIARESTS
jgi:hypothetical protein